MYSLTSQQPEREGTIVYTPSSSLSLSISFSFRRMEDRGPAQPPGLHLLLQPAASCPPASVSSCRLLLLSPTADLEATPIESPRTPDTAVLTPFRPPQYPETAGGGGGGRLLLSRRLSCKESCGGAGVSTATTTTNNSTNLLTPRYRHATEPRKLVSYRKC